MIYRTRTIYIHISVLGCGQVLSVVKIGKQSAFAIRHHLRSSPKQIVLLLYSLVKHNCHKHQETSSCSEFRVQNHHKNQEI